MNKIHFYQQFYCFICNISTRGISSEPHMLRIVHLDLYQSYLLLLLNLHIQFEISHPYFLLVRVNRCMTLSTNLRFPCINFSLASKSPFFILTNNSCFSSFDSTGSFAVFTPAISTFLIKLKTPF